MSSWIVPRLAVPVVVLGVMLALAPVAAGSGGTSDARAARAHWRRPVAGPVAKRFRYVRTTPFARGGRRGVLFAATAGARVVAPCAGLVTYAGHVPGRADLAVSLRCGRLTATLLGLADVRVGRGGWVFAGEGLGAVGPSGRVHLGARVSRDRFGYVDPLALLGPPPGSPPPLLPVRRVRGPEDEAPVVRAPIAAPVTVRVPSRLPALVPRRTPVPAPGSGALSPAGVLPPRRVPLAAWLGLALLAVALPAGGIVTLAARRRTNTTRRTALASCPHPPH